MRTIQNIRRKDPEVKDSLKFLMTLPRRSHIFKHSIPDIAPLGSCSEVGFVSNEIEA